MFQPLLLNGKTGAIGLNAQHPVARGSNSGSEHAVNQSLEATTSVLGMRQRLTIARHLIVQVIEWCFVHGFRYCFGRDRCPLGTQSPTKKEVFAKLSSKAE